ncbi:MAG: hypothetical protein B7Z15_23930, partial [Rhizobiales bacterium 32-66-8]
MTDSPDPANYTGKSGIDRRYGFVSSGRGGIDESKGHRAQRLHGRRHRQAALRVLPRTSRPRRLYRHLRTRPSDRRRAGNAPRR